LNSLIALDQSFTQTKDLTLAIIQEFSSMLVEDLHGQSFPKLLMPHLKILSDRSQSLQRKLEVYF
jgi:hypothetical protein